MSERDMTTLLALVEKHLGSEWLAVVRHLRQQNKLEDVADAVERGDVQGVIQGVEDAAAKFAGSVADVYVHAGKEQAAWLDGQVETALIRFDQANPYAIQWAQRNQLTLVREITNEQRQVVQRVIVDGLQNGDNPLTVARTIRQSIGLTDYQAQIVQRYRQSLESGNLADALDRELGDGRYDRSLRAAMRDARAIPDDQIDRMVEAYRQNWVTYRAQTIARTEGLRSLHEGSEEAIRQAIASGDVEADSLIREWNHAAYTRRSRRGHVEMDGEQRKVGEVWTNPMTGVSLRYPGDPAAGGGECSNCRCCLSTRMVA